jgi:hypothetical protein
LAQVHGTAIIPGSAIVMKVFYGLVVSIVAKLTLSSGGSPFKLNENIPDKNIHTVKKITMLVLIDSTCLIFFERGKEGSFS